MEVKHSDQEDIMEAEEEESNSDHDSVKEIPSFKHTPIPFVKPTSSSVQYVKHSTPVLKLQYCESKMTDGASSGSLDKFKISPRTKKISCTPKSGSKSADELSFDESELLVLDRGKTLSTGRISKNASPSPVRSHSAMATMPAGCPPKSCPKKTVLCSACRPRSAQSSRQREEMLQMRPLLNCNSMTFPKPYTSPHPASKHYIHNRSGCKLAKLSEEHLQQEQLPSPYSKPNLYVPDSLTWIGSSKTLPITWQHQPFTPSKINTTKMGSVETPGLYRKVDTRDRRAVQRSNSMKVGSQRSLLANIATQHVLHEGLSDSGTQSVLGKPRKLQRSSSMTIGHRCDNTGCCQSQLVKLMEAEVELH